MKKSVSEIKTINLIYYDDPEIRTVNITVGALEFICAGLNDLADKCRKVTQDPQFKSADPDDIKGMLEIAEENERLNRLFWEVINSKPTK